MNVGQGSIFYCLELIINTSISQLRLVDDHSGAWPRHPVLPCVRALLAERWAIFGVVAHRVSYGFAGGKVLMFVP